MSLAQFMEHEARLASKHPATKGGTDEPESTLHDKISKLCKQLGWIAFHGSMAHRAMRTVGEPDYTILADLGRVFFVECKNKSGKLSPEQLALKVWAEKLGHTIHTIRSLEQFLELVDENQPTPNPN